MSRVTLWSLGLLLVMARGARAEIYYSADNLPGMGTCPDGQISWFMDPQEGRVIHVRVQDASGQNSERCEFTAPQRAKAEWLGRTIYVGWKSRIDAPLSGGWNGIYQMKSRGAGMVADQPVVVDIRSGRLTVSNHENVGGQETPRTVWSAPLPMGRWFSLVLKVKYSESRTGGTIEVWFDGVPQMLTSGSRVHTGATWDGDNNNMHWGIYRADEVNGAGNHYIKRPRVASTYEEADPDGRNPTPAPDAGTPMTDAGGGRADAAAAPDLAADRGAGGGGGGAGGEGGAGGTGGGGGTGAGRDAGATGGTGGAGGGGSGGAVGAGGAGGGNDPGSGGEAGTPPPRPPRPPAGGCAVGGSPAGGAGLLWTALIALLTRRRRR